MKVECLKKEKSENRSQQYNNRCPNELQSKQK